MQAASAKIQYTANGFVPDQQMEYLLLVDATQDERPFVSLFDQSGQLLYFGESGDFDALFPDQPLSSLRFSHRRSVVPVIDLLFFPEAVYEEHQRAAYAHYLLDDGVTAVETRRCEVLDSVAMYRPLLSGLSGGFLGASSIDATPLMTLLPGYAIRFSPWEWEGEDRVPLTVLGVHRAANRFTFYLMTRAGVTYLNQFDVRNVDEFNYYLIQVINVAIDSHITMQALVSGAFSTNDAYYQRLHAYVSEIQFADITAVSDWSIPAELSVELGRRLLPTYLLLSDTLQPAHTPQPLNIR